MAFRPSACRVIDVVVPAGVTVNPAGEVLVAVVADEPWAALALDDGRVVADPFRPSAVAVELLRLRARHLSAATGERRAARHGLRLPRRASA